MWLNSRVICLMCLMYKHCMIKIPPSWPRRARRRWRRWGRRGGRWGGARPRCSTSCTRWGSSWASLSCVANDRNCNAHEYYWSNPLFSNNRMQYFVHTQKIIIHCHQLYLLYMLREDINWRKKTFSFRHCPNDGGGVYPCPNFLALLLEVHFWSIKRVYFFKNANVLNF